MADTLESAHAAITDLGASSEDDLYRLLAVRLKAIDQDPQKVTGFAPKIEAREFALTSADLAKYGRTAFEQLAVAGHGVICGADAQGYHFQKLLSALNTDVNRVSAAVATVLIGQLAMAPAIATIVATLVIGKAAPTSLEALCRLWGRKIGATSTTPTAPTTPTPPPTPTPPATPTPPTTSTPPTTPTTPGKPV